jgi:SAM-dependent methyltransferase
MDRVGLSAAAVRGYEIALAARGRIRGGRQPAADDGLPLPPANLRTQVGPLHADAAYFLASGRRDADLVGELVGEAGSPLERFGSLLDWGCGCGRVLRHWSALASTHVAGCDINPRMVDWCARNLPFADVAVTELSPPLPYDDGAFELVYAFSVFTHLSEPLQHDWIRESARVLAPGGLLLLSTLGEHYASLDRLTPDELGRFHAGELVVLYERSPGTSLCSAYHPPAYVHETLARGFDVVAFRPAADDGRHDLHLLRKR